MADLLQAVRPGRWLSKRVFVQRRQGHVDEGYSAPQKEASCRVQAAEGLGDTFMEALSNPSVIGHSIIESLAPMGAGGWWRGGAMAVAPKIAPLWPQPVVKAR